MFAMLSHCGSSWRQQRIDQKSLWFVLLVHGLFGSLSVDALYSPVNKTESARLYGNINDYAYYYVDLAVGQPAQMTSVIVDTGSNLVGFPCSGKTQVLSSVPYHCGPHVFPPFNISRSPSATWVPCMGHTCNYGCLDGRCCYSMFYTEGSSIKGAWFQDLVQLGDLREHNPSISALMGCHQDEQKLFYTQRANGIIGLAPKIGGTTPTFLADLYGDDVHVNQDIFSLCFATWGGKLTVGGFGTTHLTGTPVWLPMTMGRYYSVGLQSMTLSTTAGASAIASGAESFGKAMVDSGTTYVYLPQNIFSALDKAINAACANGACGATVFDDKCWKMNVGVQNPAAFPNVLFQFAGSTVPVTWHPQAYLYQRGQTDVWCRSYESNGYQVQTVLGAAWMLHHEVIFDFPNKRLGVAEANCPSYRRNLQTVNKNEAVPQIKWQLDRTAVVSAALFCVAIATVSTLLIKRARAHLVNDEEDGEIGVE